MRTLVLVGCLLAGCSICGRAGDPSAHSQLIIKRDTDHTIEVQPGNKYFAAEGWKVQIGECSTPALAENEHPPVLSWFKVNTADWSTKKVDTGSEKSGTLKLTRVSVSDAGRYDCVAEGHTFANLSIELFVSSDSVAPVAYGPLNESDSLTLDCKADKPEWTLNGLPISDKMKVDGKQLKIESPVGLRTGVYMCSASGTGVSQIQMFQVRGAPIVVKEHGQVNKNLMEGERALLKCEVTGHPVANVTWQKISAENGKETTATVEAKADKIEFFEHKGIKNATVSVSNLEFSDSGEYVCTAANEIGAVSFNITLRVKDKLAALWPFLGIVVEVIVLVAIIFIYEKRRSPKEETVADEEEEEEEQKKALTSGETVDVRQRGVKS